MALFVGVLSVDILQFWELQAFPQLERSALPEVIPLEGQAVSRKGYSKVWLLGLNVGSVWRATLTPELPMDLTVTLGPVLQLQIIPLSKHAPPFLSASLMPWLFLNSHPYLCTLSRYLLPGEPNLWTSFKESFFPVTSKNQFTFETTLIYYAARMKLNLLL